MSHYASPFISDQNYTTPLTKTTKILKNLPKTIIFNKNISQLITQPLDVSEHRIEFLLSHAHFLLFNFLSSFQV